MTLITLIHLIFIYVYFFKPQNVFCDGKFMWEIYNKYNVIHPLGVEELTVVILLLMLLNLMEFNAGMADGYSALDCCT